MRAPLSVTLAPRSTMSVKRPAAPSQSTVAWCGAVGASSMAVSVSASASRNAFHEKVTCSYESLRIVTRRESDSVTYVPGKAMLDPLSSTATSWPAALTPTAAS